MKRIAAFTVFIFISVCLLTSCITTSTTGNTAVPNVKSGGNGANNSSGKNEPADNNQNKANEIVSPADSGNFSMGKSQSKAAECVWTLNVDDTSTMELKMGDKSIKMKYTLKLNATKDGGTTDLGIYRGQVTLTQGVDAEGLSSQFAKIIGGVNTEIHGDNVKLEIVKYDEKSYAEFEGSERVSSLTGEDPLAPLTSSEAPLAPLAFPNGMALGSFAMNGKGKLDLSASIITGYTDKRAAEYSGTDLLDYKISVEGGKVLVNIPILDQQVYFKGMITGVPK